MIKMGLIEEEEEEEEYEDDSEEHLQGGLVVGLIGHFQAKKLLDKRGHGGSPFMGSLDMGMTRREIFSLPDGVGLQLEGEDRPVRIITWDELEFIVKRAGKGQYGCWELYGDGETAPWKVSALSKTTNRPAMLCAPLRGQGPPTMVLGGFTMHRISGGDQKKVMNPAKDTKNKVEAAKINWTQGRVLDTCTGLGYTAIAAARERGVTGVVTVELDPVSLEMCRHNPWSRDLFSNDIITSLVGDCCEVS
ncbi:unnamed protein product [Discosporangium mesarthrocarpum]